MEISGCHFAQRSGDLANSEDGLAICKALYDMLLVRILLIGHYLYAKYAFNGYASIELCTEHRW
jgi:hypothetical protein